MGGGERTIEDRLAEALRREAVGLRRPLWADLNVGIEPHRTIKARWLASARHVMALGAELGFEVRERQP